MLNKEPKLQEDKELLSSKKLDGYIAVKTTGLVPGKEKSFRGPFH